MVAFQRWIESGFFVDRVMAMNDTIRVLAVGVGVLCSSILVDAAPKRPEPELKTIDNGTVKIGIDRSMGASVTWLSWEGHPENAINIHDPGRLLQQSYYAGKKLERIKDGQSKHWSPWVWNPIQGGGVGSWARVTKFEKLDEDRLVSETVPKLWDMADEEAQAVMIQRCMYEKGMPNVVEVRNRLECKREKGDIWGDKALPRHQELPACYFTRQFDDFQIYQGKGKWKKVTQKPGPPWGKVTPELNAMACFNDKGQGIGIYCPVADTHWNFGPVGGNKKAGPTHPHCVHMAPLATVGLGPKTVMDYRYWIICGSKEEVAKRLEQLMVKYKGEKLGLRE